MNNKQLPSLRHFNRIFARPLAHGRLRINPVPRRRREPTIHRWLAVADPPLLECVR